MKGYIVFLECKKGIIKTKGKEFVINEGNYAYVGSCGNYCDKRISRHMIKEKRKLHWHIDYLSSICTTIAVLVLNMKEKEIASKLSIFPSIYGFGSTDDNNNKSHLFRVNISSVINTLKSYN
jgi:Uri superfamily endonuclease